MIKEKRINSFVEKLFSSKDYWRFPIGEANLLKTKEVEGWNKRFKKNSRKNFGIDLRTPLKCKESNCYLTQKQRCKDCQKTEKQRVELNISLKHFPAVFDRIFFAEKAFDKVAQQFGLSLSQTNMGDWRLWEKNEKGSFSVAELEAYGFRISGRFNGKMKFRDAKGLFIELLKIYLDAHKDCCQW
ncbi:MAG: hypothetical protein WC499_01320 [Patescibacteria group bacterium]